jgi:hypothetical protein
MKRALIVLAWMELVKSCVVERIAGMLDKYPAVPKPITVDVSCEARYEVLTRFKRFGVETNPINDAALMYPAVPRPITVDVNWEAK